MAHSLYRYFEDLESRLFLDGSLAQWLDAVDLEGNGPAELAQGAHDGHGGGITSSPILDAPRGGGHHHVKPRKGSNVLPGQVMTNAPAPLDTPAYDGAGEDMHPSVLHFQTGALQQRWGGYAYWMAVTPYTSTHDKPYGNSAVENPSILVSNDGIHWIDVPAGHNPVSPKPHPDPASGPYPSLHHNADPELIYDPVSDRLILFYVHADYVNSTAQTVSLSWMSSADGIHWTTPTELSDFDNQSELSPAIVRVGDQWHYFAMQQTTRTIVERTVTLVDGVPQLGRATPVTFNNTAPREIQPWHLDVTWLPDRSEYAMVFVQSHHVATPGQFLDDDRNLYLATSADGINWHFYAKPLLRPGTAASSMDSLKMYRTAVEYDPQTDLLRLWYSAEQGHATPAGHGFDSIRYGAWHTFYTQMSFSKIISGMGAG